MWLPRIILFTNPIICNFVRILLGVLSLAFLTSGTLIFITGDTIILDFNILTINSLEFNFIIIIDATSLTFIGVVTLIASCVTLFRKDYMAGDPLIQRFIWLVFIFVISIIALIIRPNIIRILLGWDGLGLVSYALVIYYQNIKSFNAGILTALSNRIGDVIILISIALMASMGRFNFMHINQFDHHLWGLTVRIVVTAACTKRAQIPFSAWLPAAIAAPTPVSALVHSSTLVTAGVYLLIRFHHPLNFWGINKPLIIIAILTILMAGIGANIETDLKRIIALSTLRQLGLMIIRIGIGAVRLAYFHILSHALFKALLFICAGNIIHCRGDTQDLRKIGSITLQIPITCACLNTANLALCGAPFLAGFYSKDLILESLITAQHSYTPLIMALVATALTVTYSLRLSYYRIISNPSGLPLYSISDTSVYSSVAIIPLTVLSVIGGLILSWITFPTPNLINMTLNDKIIILPTLTTGIILRLCLWANRDNFSSFKYSSTLHTIIGSMWFIPTVATRVYGLRTINLGFNATYKLDRGWVEFITVKWVTSEMSINSVTLQAQQNNYLKLFLLTFLIWFVISITLGL